MSKVLSRESISNYRDQVSPYVLPKLSLWDATGKFELLLSHEAFRKQVEELEADVDKRVDAMDDMGQRIRELGAEVKRQQGDGEASHRFWQAAEENVLNLEADLKKSEAEVERLREALEGAESGRE